MVTLMTQLAQRRSALNAVGSGVGVPKRTTYDSVTTAPPSPTKDLTRAATCPRLVGKCCTGAVKHALLRICWPRNVTIERQTNAIGNGTYGGGV